MDKELPISEPQGQSEDPFRATTGPLLLESPALMPAGAVLEAAGLRARQGRRDGDEEDDTDWTQTTGHRYRNCLITPVTSRTILFTTCDARLRPYRLRMENPPRVRIKCGAAHGRRAWIGAIPRGSTVLITEGHISLTAVSVVEVGFPPTTCRSKTPKDGHGNRVQGWTRPWAPEG